MADANTIREKINEKKLALAEVHPDDHKRAGKNVVWGRGRRVLSDEIATLEAALALVEGEPKAESKPAKKKASKKVAKKKASKKVKSAAAEATEESAPASATPTNPYIIARQAQRAVIEKHGLGTLEVTDLYGVINAARAELDAKHETGKRKGQYVVWGRGRAVKQAEVDGLEAIKAEAIEAFNVAYATAAGEPAATGTTG